MDDDPVLASAPDTVQGDSHGDAAISIRPKGNWATREQWAAARPTVKQLYMEENIPLKQVMSIMETQHNLYATTKMYKNKLNEWGFFKTFKPREVLDALRILEDRRAAGEQDAKLTMRGTEVDVDWIRGYIKRNKKRINKITRLQSGATDAAGNRKILADMMTIVSGSASPDSNSPPTLSLATPEGIRQAEELLTSMNVYVDSASSRNIWFVDSSGFYRSRKGSTGTYYLYDFWDRLDTASQAMHHSQQVDLIALLNPAFTYLNDIIREEDPRSFPFLLGCFEVLRLRGRTDLLETFLKHTWQLSSTLLGPSYPHSRIWKQAYLMFRNGTHQDLIEQIFLLLLDRYHSQGTHLALPAGVNPHSAKHSHFRTTPQDATAYHTYLENLELTIRQQLEHIDTHPTHFTNPPTTTLNHLATLRTQHASGVRDLLRRQGHYQEAEEALHILQPPTSSPSPSPSRSTRTPDKALSLHNLATLKLQQGDPLSAEHFNRVANHLTDNPSIYRDEPWIKWIIECLSNVLSLQGQDRATEWEMVKQVRATRLRKERDKYQAAQTPSASKANWKSRIKASGEGAVKNLKLCAGAPGVGCPRGQPQETCPLEKPVT